MSEHANPKPGIAKSGVAEEEVPDCPRCGKPLPLCICDSVKPVESRLSLLILQHPQEQDRALGTAQLTAMHFKDAVVKIGLSWPSLSKALGRKVDDPSRWAVLYLGSAKVADLDTEAEIVAINRKGEIEPHQRAILSDIEGVVLLDGTWSQAKALWWRNAWMLKCQRIILGSQTPIALRQAPQGAARRRPFHHRGRRPAAGGAREAARHRGGAQRQFRPHAGTVSGSPGRHAGTRAEAEETGFSPSQAQLIPAFNQNRPSRRLVLLIERPGCRGTHRELPPAIRFQVVWNRA